MGPAKDLVFIAGLDETALKGPAVNGGSAEHEFVMRAGQRVRLRFVNIQPELPATFELVRDSLPTAWRPVAKDGFELPVSRRSRGPPVGFSIRVRRSMRCECRRRQARISCE